MAKNSNIQKAVNFLNGIGIKTVRGNVPNNSFIPGIKIWRGSLFYNHRVKAADLLHEAGHIAVVPSKYRIFCTGDMDKSYQRIWKAAAKNGDTDPMNPICQQIIQASECEAIAWSWAAGTKARISARQIIPDDLRYFGGEGAEIRQHLAAKCHFGINGLRAAGMLESVKTYPQLARWVQL